MTYLELLDSADRKNRKRKSHYTEQADLTQHNIRAPFIKKSLHATVVM